MNAGGYQLDFTYNVSLPAISTTNTKIHINSTISDAHIGARYLGIEISNFYLGIDIPYHQYMWVHTSKIPEEIWDEYDINIALSGLIYPDICKGMYGLREASVLAFNKLIKDISPHG